ncbi:MAG: hypothetical protein JW709_14385 [Sedimentisphaerales bacterium]|nr:hypothetical protein [Sedimentisphaerales bacterium]
MIKQRIQLGHSPDPDDAFMFYALAKGKLDTGPYEIIHIHRDIQTLNDWAKEGKLDVTAISVHAYAHVQKLYALMTCGASMGATHLATYEKEGTNMPLSPLSASFSVNMSKAHGPLVVANRPMRIEELSHAVIAVPGTLTSAFLALQLALGGVDYLVMMFDEIPQAVKAGKTDAGLLIHESQITYEQEGLYLVIDLGQWWFEQTHLPLPLGCNVIRRDLPLNVQQDLGRLMRASIDYSLAHRDEALAYAMEFGRGLEQKMADIFVGMYVNEWTLDYGPAGRRAVTELLHRGHQAGLTPKVEELVFI